MGGGDGKVDTETSPVASQIESAYYYGEEKPSGERWALAFSAAKQWQRKVKSDVKKIAETGRGYKRIIFVTNQYAKASTRAEIEDELTKENQIQVTIHDKTWILDRVFANKRQKLAIEELKMGEGLEEKKEISTFGFAEKKTTR